MYQPAPLLRSQYAICVFTSNGDEAGMVRLAQFPGKAVVAQTTLEGLEAEAEYDLTIRTYGFLGAGQSFCMASGAEYNPLKEFDRYMQPNPYQDPTRGVLENVTADDEGAVSSTQQKLLQNLSGPESLIGRSIHLTSVT